MANTTLGPTFVAGENRYYVTFNSGGVGHSNGHSVCLLSSVDGERWEKVIERPSIEWTISTDATRGALCPKLLPTDDRLIVMFYYYAPGRYQRIGRTEAALQGSMAGTQRPLSRASSVG